MEATSGFFQKCQQYLNFRGSNSNGSGKISQNYQVGSEDSDIEDNEQYDEDSNNDQSLSSRFTPFQRSYQKVSTEDKTTKYEKSLLIPTLHSVNDVTGRFLGDSFCDIINGV